MINIRIDNQIKYALEEVKTYPRGYEFEIKDIIVVKRCIGAYNLNTFEGRLRPLLLKECVGIGNKFIKK